MKKIWKSSKYTNKKVKHIMWLTDKRLEKVKNEKG